MLFLVNSEAKGAYPLPAEQWLELCLKHVEAIMDYKKQGKVVVHGGFVGRKGGIVIYDVESNEELQKLESQLPLWPFMETEITPLISTEEALVSLRASKK